MPSGNEQTSRMKCLLSKNISLSSDEDLYVNGGAGTFIRGGSFAHLCPPPGQFEANFGSNLTPAQKAQFFSKVSHNIMTPNFAPEAADSDVIAGLDNIDRSILQAINCLDSHIERQGIGSDKWRLQQKNFIAQRQRDNKSIYSCYR